MSRILVVDDEQSICWGFARLGQAMGHQVATAPSAERGLTMAADAPPDLLVLDVRLPGMDGLTAMDRFRRVVGDIPIIVITAFGDLQTAVEAVRRGAVEYVPKPFDLAEIRSVIDRAMRRVQPSTAAQVSKGKEDLIGRTPVMQAVFKRIALAAAAEANVLIQGESGTGKELTAAAIHRHSARSGAAFVAVNVAALSPSLAESELFGHVQGAFTGAQKSRPGLLVEANGGTLFLDEVADIPLPLQVKLLRAIEQGEVLPVGADRPTATRFRVISATHQDLKQQVRKGSFRQDLYFRISAFEIRLPPLRQRVDDIPLLANHFASQVGNGTITLSPELLEEIKRRRWQGNVRELRNAIEHVQVVARSGIATPEHLPPVPANIQVSDTGATGGAHSSLLAASSWRAAELLNDPDAAGSIYDRLISEVEGPLLARAMQRFDQECAPAARALGLHRTTLKKKLDQHRGDEG